MPSRSARRAIFTLGATLLLGGLIVPRASRGGPERLAPDRDAELPATLHLQWVRELPAPRPAWPDQPKMPFDAAARPVAVNGLLVVPSSATDSVTAYDAAAGEERWRFTADGPVRFAPVVWRDRLFVVSDDGYLYCLDAAHGRVLWKFRGGPSDRKVLGNGRLISTWPARGAPAVADGTVYFAAGIWPFMGIFLHALDARTGEVVWTNDGDGSTYMKQPHQADSFAGVAPQGALVVVGDKLLVPGGRSVPACYERRTGKLVHFRLADNGKTGGGSDVVAGHGLFFNGGAAFDLATGDPVAQPGEPAVLTGDVLYSAAPAEVRAYDLKNVRVRSEVTVDYKGKKIVRKTWTARQAGSADLPRVEALIRAGARLIAARPGEVMALDLPLSRGDGKVSWRVPIDGRPAHLLAAAGRLFVSTREGRLFCFGEEPVEPRHFSPPASLPPAPDAAAAKAEQVLALTGVRAGYGVVWGAGAGRLVRALAGRSSLHLIVVDADAAKAAALREELTAAGLYGERVAVLPADPDTVQLPPYFASLMVSEDLDAAGMDGFSAFLPRAFAVLRPYGGVACLALSPGQRAETASLAADPALAQARVRDAGAWTLVTRDGPLPGAAGWTHEHADAANTRVSRDRVVKAPLGLLWFGGTSNDGVLPRHGHGPQPQVLDGRVLIEGADMMRAVDVYTGRLLWETKIPGVGKAYDNLAHQPGANAGGGNYVTTHDAVYVAAGASCVVLDPATGRRLGDLTLPPPKGQPAPTWDFVTVLDDTLIAGVNPPPEGRARKDAVSSSRQLVALHRHSGRVLWTATARSGFRHNAVCLGGGRLYAIDRPSLDLLTRFRRPTPAPAKPRVAAFDLRSGKELWSSAADVFGTWLSYSADRDVLVECGRVARDTLLDEPKGMRAYKGADGSALWYRKDYVGPAMIHGDTILKDRSACDLRTGAPVLRDDLLTGEKVEWTWTRAYGCNTPMASEHLLTFRSGAAGYYDLCRDGGTGNLGGFRSGCTNNLVVADGLLCAPDYTRTCTCSYQNQTSVALVPVTDGEMWTYFGTGDVKGPVRRAGINLGAPGNRKAEDGTLWLEYPSVGGPSPRLAVKVEPAGVEWFRRHESRVDGAGHPWVAASGARGVSSVNVTLAKDAVERTYTLRLFFLEPDRLVPGQRVFDVGVPGRTLLRDFDVAAEAGRPLRGVVKEFRGVKVIRDLSLTLTPADAGGPGPVLSGIEVVAEGW